MAKLTVQVEVFTNMTTLIVEDDLTHQILVLTPAEAQQLKTLLDGYVVKAAADDPASNREAGSLKALTLYNGHSLPPIDRKAFEAKHTVTEKFDFQLIQRLSDGTTKEVKTL